MDGLKISTAESLLKSGNTVSEINSNRMAKEGGLDVGNDKSFSETLSAAVQQVNELQKESDMQIQKLATGETKNIPEVMISVEKADIALKLMTQVRNKIIDAYQEIMKMQV